MSGKNAAKLCFWFKTAAAVLFLAALAGLCYYSMSVLPERIKEGVEGSGAPVFAAVFGGGIAIAVVISLTILFCGIAAVMLIEGLLPEKEKKEFGGEICDEEKKRKRLLRSGIFTALTIAV